MRRMTNDQSHKVHLSPEDQERLRELRAQRPARSAPKPALTPGAVLADRVAETVGSWRFIIIQSAILGIWIILNMMCPSRGGRISHPHARGGINRGRRF